ncbi:MAG: GNAT family N-acetyltransferase [Micromonosporaceae bacterium]
MLDQDDVGHRVVVRHFVQISPAGRPIYTDLLGDLIVADGEQLVVRTSDGTEHAVPTRDVVAGKRIPARRPSHAEITHLERVADEAWPAPVHERLGDWMLRAADGFTDRANSALPLGEPDCPLPEAIAAVAAWYRARGLPPRITSPLPLRREVDRALADLGWLARTPVLVQTADLAAMLAGPLDTTGVRLHRQPSAGFRALAAGRKGPLPAAADHVLTAVAQVRFAEAYALAEAPDQVAGIARGALVGDGRWLHLGLVDVATAQRRHGLATRLSQALAAWAAELGATRAVLQVEEDNTAAIALYARLGFTTHHRYVTRVAPA